MKDDARPCRAEFFWKDGSKGYEVKKFLMEQPEVEEFEWDQKKTTKASWNKEKPSEL